jgi:putative transposase
MSSRADTAILCETDEYLLTLVRYVHQNPVQAGLAARPEDYRYSGHRAYLGGVATPLVDPTFVLNLVGGTSGYLRLIASGRVGSAPVAPTPPRASLSVALSSLARGLLVNIEVLRGPDRGRPASRARALAAYVLVRRLGYRMTDVAAALGRNIATTSGAAREVSEQLPQDEAATRQVEQLVESLEAKVEA